MRMKKSAPRATLILILILAVVFIPAFVGGMGGQAMAFAPTSPTGYTYIVDEADILADSEEAQLESQLLEIRERLGFDVVIVTTPHTGSYSTTDYADKFYEDNGYGYGPNRDGVLLLVSMEDGRWATSTAGYGITALTDYGLSQIEDELVNNLNKGNFARAFETFADRCDEYVTSAKNGYIIDVGNEPKKPFPWASRGIIALLVGLAGGVAGTGSARSQLKTVYSQPRAGSYVVSDSFVLDPGSSRDLFLYRNVSRIPRVQNTGGKPGGGSITHVSPGGMTHGGHSGTFKN